MFPFFLYIIFGCIFYSVVFLLFSYSLGEWSQLAKLENEIVEHLSDHFNEFVALHVIALLDPVVRSSDNERQDEHQVLIRPTRRPVLMLQLAHLLQNAQCQQLQCAVLGIFNSTCYSNRHHILITSAHRVFMSMMMMMMMMQHFNPFTTAREDSLPTPLLFLISTILSLTCVDLFRSDGPT